MALRPCHLGDRVPKVTCETLELASNFAELETITEKLPRRPNTLTPANFRAARPATLARPRSQGAR